MQDFREIEVTLINPDPGQPRKKFDETDLIALAENMKKISQQVPVIVYEVDDPEAEGFANG